MTLPQPVRVDVGDVLLGCWDTGGDGDAVVLMHAAWGSGPHWEPQLAALREAGFRAVAWSRRGHLGSDAGPMDTPSTMADDLDAVTDALGIGRFHLVGTGLGAFGALDHALTRPDRLLSLTVAASLCGVTDPDFTAETRRLVTPELDALPIVLRELSPAYRYASPAGTRRWLNLTRDAVHTRVTQGSRTVMTRSALGELSVATTFVAGDADPYMPPERTRELAHCVSGSTFRVVTGAGHSPAWEQPEAFNRHLIASIRSVSPDHAQS